MPKISDYVKEALEKGYDEKDIYEIFYKKGYDEKEIRNALNLLRNSQKSPNQEEKLEKISMIKKIGFTFSKPKEFFSLVRDEGIGKSLGLFSLIVICIIGIGLLAQAALYMIQSANNPSLGIARSFFSFGFIGFAYIFVFVVLFISTFLYSGISHLIIKAFKGEGKYFDTYNAYTYSLIPFLIITIIPLLGYLSFIYSIVLMTFGYAKYHNISYGKAVTAAIVPALVIIGLFVGFVIWFLMNLRF